MTVPLMHALVAGGADVIELGVPFSDPMADGPVIQRASERALKHGVGLRDVLQFVREFRVKDQATPVVLMGYANPIEHMGVERFIQSAKEVGVDGVLVVDYPPEECEEFAESMRNNGLDTIFGFGIRDGVTAKAIASVSDAVVIGSRIIQELENTPPEQAVQAVQSFITGIRQALDSQP